LNDFEKAYYEHAGFWNGDMVQDDANRRRIELTAAMVPGEAGSLLDAGCGNGVFVNYLSGTRK